MQLFAPTKSLSPEFRLADERDNLATRFAKFSRNLCHVSGSAFGQRVNERRGGWGCDRVVYGAGGRRAAANALSPSTSTSTAASRNSVDEGHSSISGSTLIRTGYSPAASRPMKSS